MATYKPTDGMITAANRALEWRREYGRGGTAVGVARARDISNGKRLSEDTVKRMNSFFSRHANNKAKHYDAKESDGGLLLGELRGTYGVATLGGLGRLASPTY